MEPSTKDEKQPGSDSASHASALGSNRNVAECFTPKPTVLSDTVLWNAVQESNEGLVTYKHAHKLHISFEKIQTINFLLEFTSLTKLQLSGNLISNISGLDHLVNLTWLDLMFNNIMRIEGLNSLEKLEVLLLSNNNISVIENMDTLHNLELFSIQDNRLDNLEQLSYLQKFKNLRSIYLFGNPLCEEEDYILFTVALLPHLENLNCKPIYEQTKQLAHSKYQHRIEALKEDTIEVSSTLSEPHKDPEEEGLITLFDSVFTDYPDLGELNELPGVSELLEIFKTQLQEVSEEIIKICRVEHQRRQSRMQNFLHDLKEFLEDERQRGVQMVQDFEDNTAKISKQELTDKELEDLTSQYRGKTLELWEQLGSSEMRTNSKVLKMIGECKSDLWNMLKDLADKVNELYSKGVHLLNDYFEKVNAIVTRTLEPVEKEGEMEGETEGATEGETEGATEGKKAPSVANELFTAITKQNQLWIKITELNRSLMETEITAIGNRITHVIEQVTEEEDERLDKALHTNGQGISDMRQNYERYARLFME